MQHTESDLCLPARESFGFLNPALFQQRLVIARWSISTKRQLQNMSPPHPPVLLLLHTHTLTLHICDPCSSLTSISFPFIFSHFPLFLPSALPLFLPSFFPLPLLWYSSLPSSHQPYFSSLHLFGVCNVKQISAAVRVPPSVQIHKQHSE